MQMMKIIKYPKSFMGFYDLIKSNIKYERLYIKLGCPTPFDVTLRDGLQSLKFDNINNIENINIETKKNIYHEMYFNYKPKNIEIGSIVSEKVLPIFKDSLDLLDYIEKHQESIKHHFDYIFPNEMNNYILIANYNKLKQTLDNNNNNNKNNNNKNNNKNNNYKKLNYSFITSVSNSFQYKNTKMNLQQSDEDILNMIYFLDDKLDKRDYKIKLYVSCINECPIEGKVGLDTIVNRLVYINNFKVDTICLSDTCGTLEFHDFKYIIDKCIENGIDTNKLSLHLHVKKTREYIVETIIHYALDNGIIEFDVSLLESGGCSVTMPKDSLCPNLSYDLYYKSLTNYLIENV